MGKIALILKLAYYLKRQNINIYKYMNEKMTEEYIQKGRGSQNNEAREMNKMYPN